MKRVHLAFAIGRQFALTGVLAFAQAGRKPVAVDRRVFAGPHLPQPRSEPRDGPRGGLRGRSAIAPNVYYVVTAAGGVWRSENRGNDWTSIFDNAGSFNMCCILIDPKDSNILWIGTGENSNPRSAMFGDGVYKSTDAGKTWARVGLENSEHIGNMAMDPRNPQVVYVAAQGPLWSAGGDRGIYKTTDGGKTWKQVLNIASAPTRAATRFTSIPNNPDVLYASTWQRRRGVGQMIGGGPESGIYKSTNGGSTWTEAHEGPAEG